MSDTLSSACLAYLEDRGAVAVTGADAATFLQGLLTNDVSRLTADREQTAFAAAAAYAGLLSPQGKILFDFFVARTPEGFVLDVSRDLAPALAKRLSMYKLRAAVDIADVSSNFRVMALWGRDAVSSGPTAATVSFDDPRQAQLGKRLLAEAQFAADIASASNGQLVPASAYHAHRIALGVPEGGRDYAFGDAYPHEADFDIFNGVSFTKGCYVGQEVVARMQNKTVVRKRVVHVVGDAELHSGTDIMLGEIPVGRIGSVDGPNALAMLRLDRAIEAQDSGLALTAHGTTLTVDAAALNRYRASIAARPAAPGFSS